MTKKIVKIFTFIIGLTIGFGIASSFDQSFPSVKLRYGYQYKFTDTFNNGSQYAYLSHYIPTFTEYGDYNGGVDPSFILTPELTTHGLDFIPNESIKAVISDKYYNIGYYPTTRLDNNIEIVYDVRYYLWDIATSSWSAELSHTEYQPYMITWCGDGIIDNYIDQYTGVHITEICDDGNTTSGDGCSATCTSEGGGTNPACISGGVTGLQTSPITVNTPNLCKPGDSFTGFQETVVSGVTHYLWSCAGRSGGSCSASYSGGGGGGGGTTYCGDGIVQRPSIEDIEVDFTCQKGTDSFGNPINGICTRIDKIIINEECDFGNEADWSFCNTNCTYKDPTIPGHCQSGISCEITIPNGGKIVFGPDDNVIIGAGMNPYIAHSLGRPYIRNLSDYDMYFDQICVVDKSGTTLLGSSKCETAGILQSGTTKYFSTTPNFVGAEIITGNYGDNRLITTIKHNGIRYDNAFFISKLDVRVAKSSIATTGGGTTYFKNTSNIGNVSDIANNGTLNPDNNKNFVGVGVSTGDISSYSNKVNDTLSVNTVKGEGNTYTNNINQISNTTLTAIGNTSSLSGFGNYNGISNVFILKNKNFIVNSNIFAGLNGSRTYIIENGDLNINTDINYSDNIAFVVRGGNININKSVLSMDGTYITIAKNLVGGLFKGIGGDTTYVLVIKGSLYGNIDSLVSTRTYIKQNSNNQIDVGTIVSFGSSLFRKPAPLLSTFINEYLVFRKIAK